LIISKAARLVETHGARNLLDRLFDASVIGVRIGDAGSARFKSEDSELVLPSSGGVYVHQSLYRGLKIRETRRAAPAGADKEGAQYRATIELQSRMMKALPIQDLTFLGVNPTPAVVIQNDSFDTCASALGQPLMIEELAAGIARPNLIDKTRHQIDSAQYSTLRTDMLEILSSHGLPPSEYLFHGGTIGAASGFPGNV